MLPLADNHSTYLIVGLGNPGRDYHTSRHNIGFMLVSHLAELLDVSFSRLQSQALVTRAIYEGQRVILAKPQTFMNLSGQAVRSLVSFYKIQLDQLMVVYDDVDLPFDRIRIRPSGGSGGQKGMQSIIEQLGTQDFPRMRLGVGRPPGSKRAAAYVLRSFSDEETDFLPPFLDRAAKAALTFVAEDLVTAMNRFNTKTENEVD